MFTILLNSNTQWVLFSTMIFGIAAGTMGCLAYWKRQSLMSDALAHAALPGVVIAFLLLGEKNLFVMIIGASISALIGASFIQWIRSSTRISADTAMGMVLSIFFGLGIMLLTVVNRTSGGNQSGLDSFIFGQAASMVRSDVTTMLILALAVILIVFIAFKEWKIYLFDPEFAKGLGLSLKWMNGLYTTILVTTIVIGIQAVGVILIAALLIIPSVSARYWTQSFQRMIIISALFGGAAGALGTFISALGRGWPTGPFIVIVASALFFLSLFFGKEKGILVKYLQLKMQKRLVNIHTSKALRTKGVE
ncbi:MAG: manganese ABC transporter [Bacillaceae bacterium]|jgi:ABC-type Mn2+/Zn2+ transport systems, permease components|uniref:Manganese ABC transporter n=2 Tax=Aeribacillus TaxID=1055323 RepID=A0A164BQ99_9BACI|nr:MULTISPECIES: iron chelate uptake ABC transporter family permease subunit [Aeribacillus]AXI38962.1 manganese ABC transporter [Bacillaceae bacterium ZC4]REJ12558.1 MAG: manganese ABC transporter [Bacillaceae bacterium]ASS90075.1 manganese ABC transporter [Aeribacillus pallidus]KZM57651.1 manganese ABC transporter [Aeribacillus pallidus]MDR9791442.1 iron chelate uptake ABC transporter family permease subunit [Aeribacillus pallidus]